MGPPVCFAYPPSKCVWLGCFVFCLPLTPVRIFLGRFLTQVKNYLPMVAGYLIFLITTHSNFVSYFRNLENCQLRVFFLIIECQIKEPPVQVIRNIIKENIAILLKEPVKEPVNISDPVL
jgi:hypothetical protein